MYRHSHSPSMVFSFSLSYSTHHTTSTQSMSHKIFVYNCLNERCTIPKYRQTYFNSILFIYNSLVFARSFAARSILKWGKKIEYLILDFSIICFPAIFSHFGTSHILVHPIFDSIRPGEFFIFNYAKIKSEKYIRWLLNDRYKFNPLGKGNWHIASLGILPMIYKEAISI